MQKKHIGFRLFSSLGLLAFFISSAHAHPKPFLVVIDPGHGGNDDGALFYDHSRAIKEKDITLRLALQTVRELEASGIRAVLTRRNDRYLPLPDRTALANRLGADIFISADFKYHQFFDAESQIIIADIGHFESEQFTLEIFYELLIKKLSNFAIYFTKAKNNPINYI